MLRIWLLGSKIKDAYSQVRVFGIQIRDLYTGGGNLVAMLIQSHLLPSNPIYFSTMNLQSEDCSQHRENRALGMGGRESIFKYLS